MKGFFYLILIVLVLYSCSSTPNKKFRHQQGQAFGTMYNITYEWDKDLNIEIDSLIKFFNNSLSNYDKNSNLSQLNYNKTTEVDDLFKEVYDISLEAYNNTEGALDISIAPIVNEWGFGWEKKERNHIPDSLKIAELLELVGHNKLRIENNQLIKSTPNMMIIGNAVAKGLSVDFISDYFIKLGIENYIIEIGGEIFSKGKNPKSEIWKIGIDKPVEESWYNDRENQLIISISEKGIATSGNYRQFIKHEGEMYGHSIDPRTGYPAKNELLSVTVISDKCAVSDAYATGFMILGLEKSLAISSKIESIEACFIYEDSNGKHNIKYSSGFEDYIIFGKD